MAQHSPKQILLVEDDEILGDALSMKLRQSGFSVVRSKTGGDAVDLAAKHMPDLVLLDIILPDIKGTTILKQLKKDDRVDHIPVIMLTNISPHPSLVDELRGCEPAFYLVKSESSLDEIVSTSKDAMAFTSRSS
jgi:DNA-binding response OmpR family regulator